MLVLIPYFKLEGVGLGRLIGCTALLIYILFVEKKVFGRTLWSFWRKVLLLLIIPTLFAGIAEFVSINYILKGWVGLFLACGLGAAVYLLLMFFTKFLTFEDRLVVQRLFSKLLPRFS